MNEKTKRVFKGWMSLSDSERNEFEAEVQRYKGSGTALRESIRNSTKVASGPLSEGCPCCGR